MRIAAVASRLLGLALFAGASGGCECPGFGKSIPAGEVAPKGIDPQRALEALPPQTLPLRWVQLNEWTELTITTLPAVEPSTGIYYCDDGGPHEYAIRAILMLETADGRLRGRATTARELEVSASGELTVRTTPGAPPSSVGITLPASILTGTGVAPDPVLERPENSMQFSVSLVDAGTAIRYGSGWIGLAGNDPMMLAEVGP